jgi:hypothetical protein
MVNQPGAKYCIMPKLSLYRPNRTRDYQYLDRTIREQYTVGGLDIFLHKYAGPPISTDDSSPGDATQPKYDEQDALNVQDLLLLENRDRVYEPDIYVTRGVYNTQDVDFDLSQFGLFLNNDTLFITFHYNAMIDTVGRKIMSGDVLELPNLKDYNPLNPNMLPLPKYYVVQEGSFASEGFSQTWLPHLWRVKATPMTDSQEFNSITNRPFVSEYTWDPDDYYPAGSIVSHDNTYYRAVINTPADTAITDTDHWAEYTPPTLSQVIGTRTKDLDINDAILAQANSDVPSSGFDVTKFYIAATTVDGRPANPRSLTIDDTDSVDGTRGGMNVSPRSDGYTVGYLTGDGEAPNGLPVTPGTSFPASPVAGDYCLRLDYFPNRLFRFDGRRWVKIEEKVRTSLDNSVFNTSQRSGFVNNSYTVPTKDQGHVPSRQSLSDLLRPQADNGMAGGNKTENKYPTTYPGQKPG